MLRGGCPDSRILGRSEAMSDMDKPIAIVGAYPPPIGGNAIHIQRLSLACRRRGFDCHVIDMYGKSADGIPDWVYRPGGGEIRRLFGAMVRLLQCSWALVHFHVSSMDRFILAAWPLLLAAVRSQKRIITIHSGSFVREMRSRSRGYRRLAACLLDRFSLVITVNDQQRDFLCNDMRLDPCKIKVIPAFIPLSEERRIELPEVLRAEMKEAHTIVGSGYARPVYGHHLLLEAVRQLQSTGMDVSLVIALYSEYDSDYLSQLEEATKSLKRCVLIKDLDPAHFNSLLSESEIYVRTTFTDGDAISIREALHNGCTVLASDCVPRPPGVILFQTGSVESLYDSLGRVIAGRTRADAGKGMERDYSQNIISLYERLSIPRVLGA